MANRWVALAIVFVTRTSMGFQFQAVASVAPLIVGDLGLSYAQLGTLVGIYMLPGAFFALPAASSASASASDGSSSPGSRSWSPVA